MRFYSIALSTGGFGSLRYIPPIPHRHHHNHRHTHTPTLWFKNFRNAPFLQAFPSKPKIKSGLFICCHFLFILNVYEMFPTTMVSVHAMQTTFFIHVRAQDIKKSRCNNNRATFGFLHLFPKRSNQLNAFIYASNQSTSIT